jgi:hypothetical protein
MKHYEIKPYMNYARNLQEGSVRENDKGMIRTILERKGWLKRKLGLCVMYPTLTVSNRYPNHVFYYGYARTFMSLCNSTSEEYILGVAAYDEASGLVWFSYPKARHHNLLHLMAEYGYSEAQVANVKQGFLTTKGRYVDREQALAIAKTANQLIKKTDPPHKLFSEDLFTGGLTLVK